MPDIEEILLERINEIETLKRRVKQLEAEANSSRRQDSKRLGLLVQAMKKLGYESVECPGCDNDGWLYKVAADGDMVRDHKCADCNGTGSLQLEDM